MNKKQLRLFIFVICCSNLYLGKTFSNRVVINSSNNKAPSSCTASLKVYFSKGNPLSMLVLDGVKKVVMSKYSSKLEFVPVDIDTLPLSEKLGLVPGSVELYMDGNLVNSLRVQPANMLRDKKAAIEMEKILCVLKDCIVWRSGISLDQEDTEEEDFNAAAVENNLARNRKNKR